MAASSWERRDRSLWRLQTTARSGRDLQGSNATPRQMAAFILREVPGRMAGERSRRRADDVGIGCLCPRSRVWCSAHGQPRRQEAVLDATRIPAHRLIAHRPAAVRVRPQQFDSPWTDPLWPDAWRPVARRPAAVRPRSQRPDPHRSAAVRAGPQQLTSQWPAAVRACPQQLTSHWPAAHRLLAPASQRWLRRRQTQAKSSARNGFPASKIPSRARHAAQDRAAR